MSTFNLLLLFYGFVLGAYVVLIYRFTRSFNQLILDSEHSVSNNFIQLSIVIPFKNEAAQLPLLLGAIQALDYPKDCISLILVNDHSTDNFSNENCESLGLKITCVTNNGKGKKSAIETGISLASSEYILLSDADCLANPQWLNAVNRLIQVNSPDLVIMPVVSGMAANFLGKFQELEFLSLIASTFGAYRNPIMCNGANLCVKRSAFDRWRPYDGNRNIPTGDDVFLLHAAKKDSSSKIVFAVHKSFWVFTQLKDTWSGFMEQRIRWGSKAINYNDKQSIGVAAIVLLVNLILLVFVFASFVAVKNLLWFVAFFSIKMLFDFALLYRAMVFFEKQYLLKWYFTFAFVYIFYLPFAAFAGIVRNLTSYHETREN